ncbi:MAG: formimidoylglutamate deiminase [Bryobacteraceae bacterium]|jgi:formimidoylglutamate deiminase
MTAQLESGWFPDFLYRNGRFESGVAMFIDQEGRITRFSQAPGDLRQARRLPDRAILPGLVNVHSHSFQRAIRGRTERRTEASRDTFWTWREAMYHAANRLSPEDIYDVARMAFLEMLVSGITTVGEFHYLHHAADGTPYDDPNLLAHQVLRAARETGLRIALLRTAYARAGWRCDLNPGQARFLTLCVGDFVRHTDALRAELAASSSPDSAWVGIAPHSVRAVPLEYLLEATQYARANQLKIHMHVAEQPAEVQACQAEFGLPPVALLHHNQALDSNFTGVHAIHVTEDEIGYLAAAGARVCACPTTERNLGDGINPADRWLQSGVGVCYGSDSNVQIDLLEDARELEYHLRLKRLERAVLAPDLKPESLAESLFASATQVGSESLGGPGGSLEVARPADFFTVDLNDLSTAGADADSLLSHIVFASGRAAIRDVFVGGEPVILEGHHVREDEIVQRFIAVQRRLWGPSST